ncbi:MAG: Crp/Fnr family transcriptional regulator [Polyangiaceae bacterium]|nr:Crp/Fnr family transcriptional regulator [Polyangiaceae bacterium]
MDVAAALRVAKPFARAPREAVDQLAHIANVRQLSRNEHLWTAGDQPSHFSVIYSGLLKILRALPNGRDAIVGLFGPRESIGDVAVMQGIPYPASAVGCSEQACVIRIPRVDLLGHMERCPGLALSISHSMGDRVHALHTKVQILSAGGVEARLASLLLELADRFGDEFEDDTIVIPIVLSRQDLANLVSTTLETTIRVMSKWQKQRWLETRSDGFVLRAVEPLRETASSVLSGKI